MTSYRCRIEQNLPDETLTFIATFSRFEYSMKRSGFLMHTSENSPAKASWDAFAIALPGDFFSSDGVTGSGKKMVEKPPRKQIVNNAGSLTWKKVDAPTNNVELFIAVRRVRNNLAHGEKTIGDQRDKHLVQAALSVLDLAMQEAAKTGQTCEQLKTFCQHFAYSQ